MHKERSLVGAIPSMTSRNSREPALAKCVLRSFRQIDAVHRWCRFKCECTEIFTCNGVGFLKLISVDGTFGTLL